MTDEEKLEAIKAEIERLKNAAEDYIAQGGVDCICARGNIEMADDIIKYINSLPEEPVSEDLGEYINELSKRFPEVSFAKLSRIAFKAGAQWQKERFEKDYTDLCNGIATAKGIAVAMAYDKGMADAKEQMMANAVDGEVTCGKSLAIPSLGWVLDKEGLDFGDKLKLIIIKKS